MSWFFGTKPSVNHDPYKKHTDVIEEMLSSQIDAYSQMAANNVRDSEEEKKACSFLREGHSKLVTLMQEELGQLGSTDKDVALRNFDERKVLLIEVAERMFGKSRTSAACSRLGLK